MVNTRISRALCAVALIGLAFGCSGDGHADPSVGTGSTTVDDGDGLDIDRPVGDWSSVASGTDGAFEWTVVQSRATKPSHRCLGWVISSSDDATQALIDERQSLLFAYKGVPYSCAPVEAGKGYDVMVPLVNELFAGTDRGVVAGFTTAKASEVRLSTGGEVALVASGAKAKVFAGTISSVAQSIDVELMSGEVTSCWLDEDFFEPTVLTIC
jgi:hypothetical protein